MRVTASRVGLLEACSWWATPEAQWFDVAGSHAERGTRFHAAIARYVKTGEREGVADDIAAEYDAAIDWVEDYGRKYLNAEVAFAWDPATDRGYATDVQDRGYPDDGRLWGSADLVSVVNWTGTQNEQRGRVGMIADFKTGDGSGAGPQLRTLALMAARAYRLDSVTVVALEVGPAGVREVCREDLDAFDLDAHAGELAEMLSTIGRTPPKPSEACSGRYCPSRMACPAHHEAAAQLVPVEALTRYRISAVVESGEHAAWMLDRVKLVEAACRQVKDVIKAACPDEGWTLADGRTLREGTRKVERFQQARAVLLLKELGATDEQLAGLWYEAEESAGLRVSGGSAKPARKRGKAA